MRRVEGIVLEITLDDRADWHLCSLNTGKCGVLYCVAKQLTLSPIELLLKPFPTTSINMNCPKLEKGNITGRDTWEYCDAELPKALCTTASIWAI